MHKICYRHYPAFRKGQYDADTDTYQYVNGNITYQVDRETIEKAYYRLRFMGKRWFEADPMYPMSREDAAYILTNYGSK